MQLSRIGSIAAKEASGANVRDFISFLVNGLIILPELPFNRVRQNAASGIVRRVRF